jgi:hypothetical protein
MQIPEPLHVASKHLFQISRQQTDSLDTIPFHLKPFLQGTFKTSSPEVKEPTSSQEIILKAAYQPFPSVGGDCREQVP